jgi:hypothetical protein
MVGGNVTDTFPSSSAMLHKEVYGDNVADFEFWLVKTPSASQGSVDDILKLVSHERYNVIHQRFTVV